MLGILVDVNPGFVASRVGDILPSMIAEAKCAARLCAARTLAADGTPITKGGRHNRRQVQSEDRDSVSTGDEGEGGEEDGEDSGIDDDFLTNVAGMPATGKGVPAKAFSKAKAGKKQAEVDEEVDDEEEEEEGDEEEVEEGGSDEEVVEEEEEEGEEDASGAGSGVVDGDEGEEDDMEGAYASDSEGDGGAKGSDGEEDDDGDAEDLRVTAVAGPPADDAARAWQEIEAARALFRADETVSGAPGGPAAAGAASVTDSAIAGAGSGAAPGGAGTVTWEGVYFTVALVRKLFETSKGAFEPAVLAAPSDLLDSVVLCIQHESVPVRSTAMRLLTYLYTRVGVEGREGAGAGLAAWCATPWVRSLSATSFPSCAGSCCRRWFGAWSSSPQRASLGLPQAVAQAVAQVVGRRAASWERTPCTGSCVGSPPCPVA